MKCDSDLYDFVGTFGLFLYKVIIIIFLEFEMIWS